jgi:hypothetical protein
MVAERSGSEKAADGATVPEAAKWKFCAELLL